jgi:RNA polymerase sigma factor (sigma-70 family)
MSQPAPSSPSTDFMQLLDEDAALAKERYELLRQRLNCYFRHRCFNDAEDLADEVISRVIRRLQEGAAVPKEAVPGFCYGVARMVALERWKQQAPTVDIPLDSLPVPANIGHDADTAILIEQFLSQLPADEREVVRDYYWEDREELANRLGLTPNALRIRVFRITSYLRNRVTNWANRHSRGMNH